MITPSLQRAVIVDDEELARSIVREYLGTHPDVTIVGECANGFEAVRAIAELTPDIVFLDIQMPKLNGFEVLELIAEHPAIIFTTAYDEYALRAFEVHAVDYLLKPFSQERFDGALDMARTRIASERDAALKTLVTATRRQEKILKRLLVRDGTRVHVIPVEHIDYIEAQDDYVCIRAEGRKHLKQEPLASLEEQLDPEQFVRIHRSFILNLERLAKIEPYAKDSRMAILKDGTSLQVSRAGYAKLKELL